MKRVFGRARREIVLLQRESVGVNGQQARRLVQSGTQSECRWFLLLTVGAGAPLSPLEVARLDVIIDGIGTEIAAWVGRTAIGTAGTGSRGLCKQCDPCEQHNS